LASFITRPWQIRKCRAKRQKESRTSFHSDFTLNARRSGQDSRNNDERHAMGLMNFIKGQLIEIIEWTDDSRDSISWRFPDDNKEIKRGAQLIVRESQVAQFVYLGEFGDTF